MKLRATAHFRSKQLRKKRKSKEKFECYVCAKLKFVLVLNSKNERFSAKTVKEATTFLRR